MPVREHIYCHGALFKTGQRIHSLPRGKGQPPKPLSDFGLRGGLEVRTAGYFLAVFALIWLARRCPGLQLIADLPPGWLVYVTVPALAAYKLTVSEPAGRPVRRWLWSIVTHKCTPANRSAGRVLTPLGVPSVHDGLTAVAVSSADPRLRRCDIRYPATVAFRDDVRIAKRRRNGTAIIRTVDHGKGDVFPNTEGIQLEPGDRLMVRP